MKDRMAPAAPLLALDLVDRAKRDLAQQEARLAKIEEESFRARKEIERLRAFLATAAAYLNDVSISAGPITSKPPTQTETLLKATVEEIRAAGRPLTIQELFTRMLHRDIKIGGASPKQNYAGILSREGRAFVRYDRDRGWDLVLTSHDGAELSREVSGQ
ncbi:MAG TPA: hypothetical protein VKY24_27340 [Reyranella sp.]|nr:hypothetical protein [Reyranella sp.]